MTTPMATNAGPENGRENRGTRQAIGRPELLVLAVAASVALVAALIARYGGVPRVQSVVGLVVILAIAYVGSNNRRAIDVRTIAWGLGLQIAFALIVLKTTVGQTVFQRLGTAINKLRAKGRTMPRMN